MSKIKEFFQKIKCVKKASSDDTQDDTQELLITNHENKPTPLEGIPRGGKRYKNGRALLIGINYYGTSSKLNGCINDVNNMFRYLTTVEKFHPDDIHILTDERHSTPRERPTRDNIISEIKWLVDDPYKHIAKEIRPDTSLFLHYSGHGSWVWDRTTKDEKDRKDETICPVDYEKKGMIKDDELRRILVDPLKNASHIKLTALFDCCHSGTMLDLRYHIESKTLPEDKYSRQLSITENKRYGKGSAKITLFSGSMDHQYSADAYINRKSQGMMTFAYLETIKLFRSHHRNLTYKKFLTSLQVYAKESNYDQIPQLSMNHCPRLKDTYTV